MRPSRSYFLLAFLSVGCGSAIGEPISAGDAGGDSASPTGDSGKPHADAAPGVDSGGHAPRDGAAPGEGGVCTEAQRTAIWARMDEQPIEPGEAAHPGARSAALLQLQGFPSRTYAESVLCVGHDLGDLLGDGTRVEGWGSSNEVQLDYDPATGHGKVLSLLPDYTGASDFFNDPKQFTAKHAYHVVVGQQVQKDGLPFEIDWTDSAFAAGTELFNGMMYTYGKPLGAYTGEVANCAPTLCPVAPSGTGDAWYFEALSVKLYVTTMTTQPAASTIARVDLLPWAPPP